MATLYGADDEAPRLLGNKSRAAPVLQYFSGGPLTLLFFRRYFLHQFNPPRGAELLFTKFDFWALVVGIFGVAVAVISAVFAYNANIYSKAANSNALAAGFAVESNSNPTSNECLSFANQLGPDSYGKLFQQHNAEMTYAEAAATEALVRCLGSGPRTTQALTVDEATKVRWSIFSKLNAYDDVFEGLAAGTALPEILCDDVASFRQENAKAFVEKASNMVKPPHQIQGFNQDYSVLVSAAKGAFCPK
ncbi:hypothetical protein [Neorhizobium galegae]|uniref:hypothetical protein n=1 Tax=Neorhizobium galegae TaxID=399 RepID=UPI0006225B34|nr:hypothetical protein [Neorhizobium galegae]CDZ55420.1 Hypothetical protein NGAL_HAMBI2427_62150 [Neorhizobium galegae bv. orientalis]